MPSLIRPASDNADFICAAVVKRALLSVILAWEPDYGAEQIPANQPSWAVAVPIWRLRIRAIEMMRIAFRLLPPQQRQDDIALLPQHEAAAGQHCGYRELAEEGVAHSREPVP